MSVEPIELVAPDGVILRGQHWIGGDTWVVLFHDADTDLDCWQPLLPALLERGYSICTLDMRGHGGSDGVWDLSALGGDLEAAIAYAHAHAAQKIAFVGAGESALPGLIDTNSQHLFAVVALSPGPLGNHTANEFRGGNVPKLLIIGSQHQPAVEAAQQIHDSAIGWLVLVRFPTADQGTRLVSGPWCQHVRENTVAFLEEHRYATGNPQRSDLNLPAAKALFRRLTGE